MVIFCICISTAELLIITLNITKQIIVFEAALHSQCWSFVDKIMYFHESLIQSWTLVT